ncbi:MAG: TetR/AcrR family transcriptional regulator [Rhodomicrobium sp.]
MHKLEDHTGPDAAHCCDTAKRQQILEGARRIFLHDGFDGASIGDIVRAAGVSKGTLYAYFPSKEKLFEALMIEDRREQAEALFTIDENDRDVAGVLRRLGQSFADMLYAPASIELLRIVIGAAAKFPGIGKAFFDAGPCRGTSRLGHYLERMTEQGVLRVDNPELAARQFLDLCKTGIHLRLLLGDRDAPKREEIERNLDSAVRVFLAAYGLGSDARTGS